MPTPLTLEIAGQKIDLSLPENKAMLDTVTDYLTQEYTIENLRFLTEMHELKQKNLKGAALTKELERIYQEYIKPGAPSQVNLSSALVDKITPNKTLDSFLAAEHEIQELLKKDNLKRFAVSDICKAQPELQRLLNNYPAKAPLTDQSKFVYNATEKQLKKLIAVEKEIKKYSKKSNKPNKKNEQKLKAAKEKEAKIKSDLLATQLLIKYILLPNTQALIKELDDPLLANHKIYQAEKTDALKSVKNLEAAAKKLEDLSKQPIDSGNSLDILAALEEFDKARKAVDNLAKMKEAIVNPLKQELDASKKALDVAIRNSQTTKAAKLLGNELTDNFNAAQQRFNKASAAYTQWQKTEKPRTLSRSQSSPQIQTPPPAPPSEASVVDAVLQTRNPPITHSHSDMRKRAESATTSKVEVQAETQKEASQTKDKEPPRRPSA